MTKLFLSGIIEMSKGKENKNKIKKSSKTLDNQKNMCYNKYNKRKGVGRYDI